MNEASALKEYLQRHEQDILTDLAELVKKDSPSQDKTLVDECGRCLQQLFQKHLQVTAEVLPQTAVGDHLKFSIGQGEEQILIVGHFDTVWDKGRLTYRVEGEKAYGPGILDMKGGVVQALWAIKAIKELGFKLNKKIVFLCNSDEEIGSVTSRAYIEAEARKSQCVLVAEPGEAHTGALKTARKGVGIFDLKIYGRAAHAGNHHEDGINAVEELAHQVIALQALTDYEKGTTVNVGIAAGGNKRNVVPEYAKAQIDVRVSSLEEADRVTKAILSLQPVLPGARLEVSGGLNRPPMVRTAHTEALFEKARLAAEEVGLSLEEASVGGGSDGNFSAALGIPTLDGLGALGEGLHAEHEHILIEQLGIRSALFANLLLKL
ncbi:M20 family metallopeptidase [Brevibacillus fulvus]|uniref:Glutamate carboxypeptidase n=1 Tax=Brevibacillus fulvus TaxID=1125967 RepID=A0A938Y0N0_9BACL|nr:M20 family metallopeptidase [Brevibacillus fulvus]MBM7591744.1 glutamate carboxypeptidase [Brevibacillus fulvus]